MDISCKLCAKKSVSWVTSDYIKYTLTGTEKEVLDGFGQRKSWSGSSFIWTPPIQIYLLKNYLRVGTPYPHIHTICLVWWCKSSVTKYHENWVIIGYNGRKLYSILSERFSMDNMRQCDNLTKDEMCCVLLKKWG